MRFTTALLMLMFGLNGIRAAWEHNAFATWVFAVGLVVVVFVGLVLDEQVKAVK